MLLRVLIDGYYLRKPRGMGRYVRELVNALASHCLESVDIHVAAPAGVDHRFLLHPEKVRYHRCLDVGFPLWEQVVIPALRVSVSPDVVHSPYNTFPIAHRGKGSQVVTVHDLMWLSQAVKPKGFVQHVGKFYRSAITRLTGYRGVTVVSTAATTACEISRRFGISVRPVHIPVELFAASVTQVEPLIRGQFFLHIGGIAAHKNTERCIRGFLRGAPEKMRLVVAGVPGDSELAKVFRSDRVVFIGTIDDSELASLYRDCHGVLFPSLNEGYGLPCLEALSFGCPLLTSQLEPMVSLVQDAALRVDPYDVHALSEAIRMMALDGDLRARLRASALRRIGDFSARVAGEALVSIYGQAARVGN